MRVSQTHIPTPEAKEAIAQIKEEIIECEFEQDYVKKGTMKKICSNIGFETNIEPLWLRDNMKLTVTGKRNDIGLMIWFGNTQYAYRHFISLQMMFNRGEIKSAIYITSTHNETVRRNRARAISKGRKPTNSAENYSTSEDVYYLLDSIKEIISVPITILGIE